MHIKKTQEMLTYMEETNLIDIWRTQHSTDRQFTYHSIYRGEYLFSRIYFLLVSFGLSSLVSKSILYPSFLSDHSPAEIFINLEEFKRGKGLWKLNCSLLRDMDYIDLVNKTIINTVDENKNIDYVLLWEMIKLKVRGSSIQYSARKKRSNTNILSALQRRLTRLKETFDQTPGNETKQDIDLVSGEIDQIIEHQIRGAQIRAKLNWINEGERPTKFFLNIEKQNSNRKHIKRISKQDGTIITGHNNILSELESFYKKLYTTNRIQGEPKPDFNNILGDLNIIKLSDTEKGECEGILKESELLASLKTTQKKQKSRE